MGRAARPAFQAALVRLFSRRARPALTVCCLADGPPAQVAAALAPWRDAAVETVVVVASGALGASPGARAAFDAAADRVVVVDGLPTDARAIAEAATGKPAGVLIQHAHEVPSDALLSSAPSMLSKVSGTTVALPTRWLLPGGETWLDEQPWWPDWQVRLVRVRGVPSIGLPTEVAYMPAPFYSARNLVVPAARRRREAVIGRIVERPEAPTMREADVRRHDPACNATRALVPVPSFDAAAVQALVAASPIVDESEALPDLPVFEPAPGGVAVDREPGEADFELLERDLRFFTHEARTLSVRVTNASEHRWVPGPQVGEPGHALSYRWRVPDGEVADGARTLLPAPVQPGDAIVVPVAVTGTLPGPAILELAVVDEGVRWLPGTARVRAQVEGPESWPTERLPVHTAASTGPAATQSIPRIIHRVWLGDAPLPDLYRGYGETWAAHHPGWEMRLWTDADVPHPPGLERCRNLSERSDLLRYAILQAHGGVYVDTDMECLRPIDDLVEGIVAFAGYEVPGRVCGAVMGGLPGHPVFDELADLAALAAGRGHFPEAVTTLLTYVSEAHDDVTLFAPHRFYPELWDGTLSAEGDAPYGRHHWAKSWA